MRTHQKIRQIGYVRKGYVDMSHHITKKNDVKPNPIPARTFP